MNREEKKKLKQQIKKDKAKLKELKKLDKQNALSEEETQELIQLCFESADRDWAIVDKLHIVLYVFLVATVIGQVISMVLTILIALKH